MNFYEMRKVVKNTYLAFGFDILRKIEELGSMSKRSVDVGLWNSVCMRYMHTAHSKDTCMFYWHRRSMAVLQPDDKRPEEGRTIDDVEEAIVDCRLIELFSDLLLAL